MYDITYLPKAYVLYPASFKYWGNILKVSFNPNGFNGAITFWNRIEFKINIWNYYILV